MGNITLILSTIALLISNCGQSNRKNSYEDIDWHNLNKVFYITWNQENDKGYHISKTRRMFIIDNKILIREYANSESRIRKIKEIEYQGDSVITAIVDYDYMISAQYSEILTGQRELNWTRMHNPGAAMKKVTLTKDKSTLVWSIHTEGFFDHSQWIDTYDILPSGYYYQNQRTTPHDPHHESFMPPKRHVFSGVYDLEEEPIKIVPDTEEYNAMEHPYESTWLEITKTDMGDVVYDYPDWHSGNSYDHLTIKVEKNVFTVRYPNMAGLTDSSVFETVLFYPNDGSYRFYPWAGICYSFKWVDKEKHICQWTIFRIDWNTGRCIGIWGQKNYINKAHNSFPVVTYDWE